MYEITIPENSSSNCFDSVFCSLLKYFGFEYEAYNIKYFYTEYYDSVRNRIYRGKSEANILLKDIYGIDLIFRDKNGSDDLLEIIRASAYNRPTGIVIDPYYCYWSPFYQKSHYFHMLLIAGIDYSEKKYICFDVHFDSVGYIKVDFDILNNNYKRYFAFGFEKPHEVKLESMTATIQGILDAFDGNLEAKEAELFDYFTKNDRQELFPKNLETSVPLINLMWIVEDKKNFPIALRYIENKTKKSVFSQVFELLAASEKEFTILKIALIKYAMSGILREDILKSMISQIFETDAKIVERMKYALKEINV